MKTHTFSFRDKVYAITKQIPEGKVMTYGQVAAFVGSPGAARAVGVCMKENSDPSIVPCHRLVASDGTLIGYAFGGVANKKALLQSEGVQFIGEKVDLQHSQWHPETDVQAEQIRITDW